MSKCFQFENISMLDHGNMIASEFKTLLSELEEGKYHSNIQQLYSLTKDKLLSAEQLEQYHIYHDCGKHLCLQIDSEGRRHYPNHAEISAKQYGLIFPEDTTTQFLILHDMHFHSKKADELKDLFDHPLAPSLFFTALAEINANSEMFGGRSSTSYKIKMKRLIQTASKFLNHIKENTNVN